MTCFRVLALLFFGATLTASAQLPVIEHDSRELREDNASLFGAFRLDETIPKMVQHTTLPLGQTVVADFDTDGRGRRVQFNKTDRAGLENILFEWSINCDAIVSARVIAANPYLCNDNHFICTDFEMEVTDVFYQKRHPFFLGSHFVLARPGGSLVLNGRPVTARDVVLSNMQEGERYLLFLHHQDSGIFLSLGNLSFELNGSTVISPHAGNGPLQLDEAQLTALVKQVVQRNPEAAKQ